IADHSLFLIRRARNDGGGCVVIVRTPDIGAQNDAIPHPHFDVLVNPNAERRGHSNLLSRGERQLQQGQGNRSCPNVASISDLQCQLRVWIGIEYTFSGCAVDSSALQLKVVSIAADSSMKDWKENNWR